MPETLFEIGKKAVDCLEEGLKLWTDTFGTQLAATWKKPDDAIQQIVVQACEVLNRQFKRRGESSLFIRVPISDRLVLIWSTVLALRPGSNPAASHFANKNENYDSALKVCFYNLCDQLSDCKDTEDARHKRGLTGWVAVTGYPVFLNHENDQIALEHFQRDHREAAIRCVDVGDPKWAQRISEFHQNRDGESRRFAAVPIKSAVEPETTIGVIRYTCPDDWQEITSLDQAFLEAAAGIISALENLKRVKTKSERWLLAEARAHQFESDGDLPNYLAFIAEHTLSEISSIYVRLGSGQDAKLRLVDAYGLSKPVREFRRTRRLHDYTARQRGLTWHLQDQDFVRFESAVDAKGWTGRNTSVFYEEAFRKVGLPEIFLQRRPKKALLRNYKIQLMGGRLREPGPRGEACGVLKVEFPRVFDARNLYGDDDKEFLRTCSEVLAKELRRYRQLYDGSWFDNAGPGKMSEFVRLLQGVTRTALFEGPAWPGRERAADYAKRHQSAIAPVVEADEHIFPTREGLKVRVIQFLRAKAPELAAEALLTTLLEFMKQAMGPK